MRRGAIPLRKYLGYAATVGLEDLIHTDWVSSDCSSGGESDEDPAERDHLRTAAHVPRGNCETRTTQWISKKVCTGLALSQHVIDMRLVDPR